jgi:hypothetical protein
VKPISEPVAEIHEAERIIGPDGTVEKGEKNISENDAVARLKSGIDVVVCGAERKANRNTARKLMESLFGAGCEEDQPHAGRMALPHFHPPGRIPEVHAFFEAPPRHARKKKT